MENQGLLHDLILFLTAVFAAYAAWRGRENGKAVEQVRQNTDGMTRDLVQAASTVARAAGRVEGRAEGKAPPLP